MDGISKTRLYSIFSGMKQRCYNPKSTNFRFYGAKGITICDEWMGEGGLSRFMEWALNNGYEEHLTIDRIDPQGPYCPRNCRWITRSENSKRVERAAYEKLPGEGLRYYRLFDMMRRRGIRRQDLAKMAHISAPTISKLAKGQPVSTEIWDRLCIALRCQPGDIVERVCTERTERP